MNAVALSHESFGLHRAAAAGDDDAVRYALRSPGADVNALDAAGKTALMCAIAGENWRSVDPSDASFMTPERVATIRTLLNHPKITLLSLNAPHASMNGVVPLGMAAWLNMPRVVRLLLEESADAVAVDAMDSHGATALMYAARDGNLEVVQVLLSHGARPDFRDSNYRTSVQFSLSHPPILWLFEGVLRRHRWRESQSADRSHFPIAEHILQLAAQALPSSDDLVPPPATIFHPEATSRLLATLTSSIRSGDLDFLLSLLFSPALPASSPSALYPMSVPILVNFPDARGWSLIHHALSVQHPSVDIIDFLYCAGADMALFTAHEQWTPLHILARCAVTPDHHDEAVSLYQLIIHLIHDLRAPLSARDKDDETCIHIAAEHGQSLELLIYLLQCDKSGTVRQLKNARGLTPLQVARPEFIPAFGRNAGILQLISTGRTSFSVASSDSLSSVTTFCKDRSSYQDDCSSVCSPSDVDISLTSHSLISNLRITSPDGHHTNDPSHLRQLEDILAESRQSQKILVQYFQDRIKEAGAELQSLKRSAERIDSHRAVVASATTEKLALKGIQPLFPRLYYRDSEDSQHTAVSQDSREFTGSSSPRLRVHSMTETLTQRPSFPTFSSLFEQSQSPPDSPKLSPLDIIMDTTKHSNHLGGRSTPDLHQAKSDSPKRKKQEEKNKAADNDKISGATRLKAWLKRMVVPSYSETGRQQLPDHGEKEPLPAIQISTHENFDPCEYIIDSALRTSVVVLDAVDRDFNTIYESLTSAERFIALANHSIIKVERAMKRAFKQRQQMITKLKNSKPGTQWREGDIVGSSAGLLGYSNLHLRPSIASISSIQSNRSSIISAAATVTEHDDEDTRVIRRLLLRKIEAQSSGAWEELEKALSWLRIVKEVVQGVKRRAYV